MFERPILIGVSPNASFADFTKALQLLLTPWKWKKGTATAEVENWFKDYFGVTHAVSFNAGRSALLAILKSLEIPQKSEVMLQAFTCVAIPNSIVWAGCTPVYVDIDKSLNFSVLDAQKKLTPHTKVVVVQHTFGIPANMEDITAFCKKNKLLLIEDCAHSLGATYQGKLVGTFGDAAFFSFGRDKIVSSIFGGVAVTSNQKLGQKIDNFHEKLTYPSYYWILQQLLHPLIALPSLYLYHFLSLGKAMLFIAQKFKLISFPIYEEEKTGQRATYFPKKYPNALAYLLQIQLNKLEEFNKKRGQISQIYNIKLNKIVYKLPKGLSGSIYLRFNIRTQKRDEIRFKMKQKGILLGNWYSGVIDPKGVDREKAGYQWGSCPEAEKVARESVNLPTYPNLRIDQTEKIITLLNHFSIDNRLTMS